MLLFEPKSFQLAHMRKHAHLLQYDKQQVSLSDGHVGLHLSALFSTHLLPRSELICFSSLLSCDRLQIFVSVWNRLRYLAPSQKRPKWNGCSDNPWRCGCEQTAPRTNTCRSALDMLCGEDFRCSDATYRISDEVTTLEEKMTWGQPHLSSEFTEFILRCRTASQVKIFHTRGCILWPFAKCAWVKQTLQFQCVPWWGLLSELSR